MYQNPLSAFPVGRKIPYGPKTISREEITAFAARYDPIYFHLDEEKAKNSMLNGLAASGFHTCSLTMRMICDAYLLQSTSQGSPGVDELEWLGPVRPGDTLKGFSTVLSSRKSNSRPDLIVIEFRHETYNQNNDLVLTMRNTGFFGAQGDTE